MAIAEHKASDVSSPMLGLIFCAAALLFLGSIGWMASGQSLILIQLPLVLFALFAVMVSGVLYFINPARWLHFFLLGLVYFSFEFTVRDPSAGGGGDVQSLIKGVLALALAAVGIFTSMKSVFRTPLLLLFFLYSAFAFASAFYSPLVLIGIAAGITLIGVSVVAAKVGTSTQDDVAMYWQVMYWASVATCLLSFAVLAVSPSSARDVLDPSNYRFRGVTGAANSLGPIMAIGCVLALLMRKRAPTMGWKYFHALMLALFLVALVLTDSRSSMIGLLGALGAVFLLSGKLGVLGLMAVGMVALTGAMVMLYPDLQYALLSLAAAAFSRTGAVTELTTFTGRQQIWEASWKLIGDQPWIGYGMSSVRVVLPQAYFDEWGNSVGTAHNSLLESLLTVGWIGTIPLFAVALWCLWMLISFLMRSARPLGSGLGKKADADTEKVRDLAICATQCLFIMLIQGFSEKAFAGHPGSPFLALGGVVATAVYITLSRPSRRVPA